MLHATHFGAYMEQLDTSTRTAIGQRASTTPTELRERVRIAIASDALAPTNLATAVRVAPRLVSAVLEPSGASLLAGITTHQAAATVESFCRLLLGLNRRTHFSMNATTSTELRSELETYVEAFGGAIQNRYVFQAIDRAIQVSEESLCYFRPLPKPAQSMSYRGEILISVSSAWDDGNMADAGSFSRRAISALIRQLYPNSTIKILKAGADCARTHDLKIWHPCNAVGSDPSCITVPFPGLTGTVGMVVRRATLQEGVFALGQPPLYPQDSTRCAAMQCWGAIMGISDSAAISQTRPPKILTTQDDIGALFVETCIRGGATLDTDTLRAGGSSPITIAKSFAETEHIVFVADWMLCLSAMRSINAIAGDDPRQQVALVPFVQDITPQYAMGVALEKDAVEVCEIMKTYVAADLFGRFTHRTALWCVEELRGREKFVRQHFGDIAVNELPPLFQFNSALEREKRMYRTIVETAEALQVPYVRSGITVSE